MRCAKPPKPKNGCLPGTLRHRPRSIAEIVGFYITHCRPLRKAARRRFERMKTLRQVVQQAGLARREDQRCEAHQCRVGFARLRPFERHLQARLKSLRSCRDFDELYETVAAARTTRVGALTIYDTAVKIGAHLGLEPTSVYLHTGTRDGARALGLDVRGGTIPIDSLPPEFARLDADEIEDCLCMFKADLRKLPGKRGE